MFGLGSSVKKSTHKEEVDRAKATFDTTLGSFSIELYAKECPETVWNFINLAEGRQGGAKTGPFYDGLVFHRVIEGFMIQGGCPEGSGRGGPGYRFADECTASLRHDGPGILSMANSGPGGTNGSQFFITLGPTPHLDGRHTVFGKVVEGLDIVMKIGSTQTDRSDRPVEDIMINKVTITR
jgi:peptidyl-prolyl cis-trans isomerase A (cyclophilin A)